MVLAGVLLLRSQHCRAADAELVVTNRGDQPVTELRVSSSQTDDWGEDRLSGAALKPGASVRVRLGHGRGCGFDVLATYPDGRQQEADNIDACKARALSLDNRFARSPDQSQDQVGTHDITLADRTPLDISAIFLSPADAAQWGDDRLQDGPVASGASTTLSYQGGCQADLRVVFENSAAEERRDINICAHPQLTIAPGWTTQEGESAVAAGFSLHNRTGSAITEIYVYTDGADQHGPNLLDGRIIQDRGTAELDVASTHLCHGTLRAVLTGHHGDIVRPGIDLCATHELTIALPLEPTVAQGTAPTTR
jgi:hypothetical protein